MFGSRPHLRFELIPEPLGEQGRRDHRCRCAQVAWSTMFCSSLLIRTRQKAFLSGTRSKLLPRVGAALNMNCSELKEWARGKSSACNIARYQSSDEIPRGTNSARLGMPCIWSSYVKIQVSSVKGYLVKNGILLRSPESLPSIRTAHGIIPPLMLQQHGKLQASPSLLPSPLILDLGDTIRCST